MSYVKAARKAGQEAKFLVDKAPEAYKGELNTEEVDRYLNDFLKASYYTSVGVGIGSAPAGEQLGLYDDMWEAVGGFRGAENWGTPINNEGSLTLYALMLGSSVSAFKGLEKISEEILERNTEDLNENWS